MDIILHFLLCYRAEAAWPVLWLSLSFNSKDKNVWFEKHDEQMDFLFNIPFARTVFVDMVFVDVPSLRLFPQRCWRYFQ